MPILETRDWVDDITQIENTDLVLGGPTGMANKHAIELAARTNWLRDRLDSAGGTLVVTTTSSAHNLNLNSDSFSTIVVLPATNGGEVVISDSGNIPNRRLKIIVSRGDNIGWANRFVKITFTGKSFVVEGSLKSSIYLYIDEYAEFIVTSDFGIIQTGGVNFGKVGDIIHKYVQPFSSIAANGAIVSRSNYPRLWELVSSIAVTEATWTANRKGAFSVGNGSTTFRVPDLRGLHLKGLLSGNEGAYQPDIVKSHLHSNPHTGIVTLPPSNNSLSNYVRVPYVNAFGSGNLNDTFDTDTYVNPEGGPENTVRNVSYTTYIFY